MKNRCEGCGAKVQTIDPNKPGFIRSEVYLKNPDNFLCERCFNLTHYNKLNDVLIDEEHFVRCIESIKDTTGLVVNIVDGFDLEGTLIENINDLFPKAKVLLVVNKFDLFLSSTKPTKIKTYISNYIRGKINAKEICVISGKKEDDVRYLIKKIDSHLDRDESKTQDIYFVGAANVGKSTIMTSVLRLLTGKAQSITISNIPGTTLDVVKIKIQDKVFAYDTPGIINKHQFTYYLNKDTLNHIIPKKYIKPKTYQLLPEQALLVGNFLTIIFEKGERINFTLTFANDILVHRTKMTNYQNIKENHHTDILKLPTIEEMNKIYEVCEDKTETFEIDGKVEIAISGLGFFSAVGKGTVKVVLPSVIKVSLREALI